MTTEEKCRIEAYSFGRMVIAGRQYCSDLIIFPDGSILDSWWRQKGHCLVIADILPLIEAGPESIVVGTGASGLMKPAEEVKKLLEIRGIEFIAQPTAEAVLAYNRLRLQKNLGACFHLTC